MLWREKYNLWQIKNTIRTNDFKRRLWEELQKEIRPSARPRSVLLLRPAFLIGSLVLFLLLTGSIGTTVYAFTSPAVNQNHPLFVIKKNLERVELALSATQESKLQVSLKHRQKRLLEIEKIEDRGKINENILSDFNKSAEEILSKAQSVTSLEERGIIMERVGEQNIKIIERLQEVKVKQIQKEEVKIDQLIERQKEKAAEVLEKVREHQEKILEQQKKFLEK